MKNYILLHTTYYMIELDLGEIEFIIKILENHKALGEDDIKPELFKMAGKDLMMKIKSML